MDKIMIGDFIKINSWYEIKDISDDEWELEECSTGETHTREINLGELKDVIPKANASERFIRKLYLGECENNANKSHHKVW